MLVSMCLSIAFIILDECVVLNAFQLSLPTGIEPFWKVRISAPIFYILSIRYMTDRP